MAVIGSGGKEGLLEAIENGVSVDNKDINGWTALHWAVNFQDTSSLRMLIEVNCRLDIRNNDGDTALSLACHREDTLTVSTIHNGKIIIKLLDASPTTINISNNKGVTPLMTASSYSSVNVVKLLIDRGAIVDMRDNKGKSALWHARSCCRRDIEPILLEKIPDSPSDMLSLLEATYFNDPVAMREAYERGCLVDEKDDLGNTALHYVVQHNDLKSVQFLLHAGCSPSLQNNEGETPLFVVCYGTLEPLIVNELLRADTNAVNICNNVGVYPLMEACAKSNAEIVKALIDAGAKINILKDGYSPLWDAQVERRYSIYSILLEAGANPMYGADPCFYINFLLKSCHQKNWLKRILRANKHIKEFRGEVHLILDGLEYLHVPVDESLVPGFIHTLKKYGVNVQFLDINDVKEGFSDALTIRFIEPSRVLKSWLATESCSFEPECINKSEDKFSLKFMSRKVIRKALADTVRSGSKFDSVLKELGLPKELRMYTRYVDQCKLQPRKKTGIK